MSKDSRIEPKDTPTTTHPHAYIFNFKSYSTRIKKK